MRLIALAAIFGLVLLLFIQSGGSPTAALSYTAFLEQVQRGNVMQVDLRGDEALIYGAEAQAREVGGAPAIQPAPPTAQPRPALVTHHNDGGVAVCG